MSPEPGQSVGRTIALARFHDGKAKANWGGRATSFALAGLIAGLDGVERVVPINGEYITHDFGDWTALEKVVARLRHVSSGRAFQGAVLKTRPFAEVEEYAGRILSRPPTARARELITLIDDADELWMNGEGDFIMGYSGTLWRSLIVMSIAQRLGKPTVLVNSILSEPSYGHAVPDMLHGVHSVLSKCRAVVYRDPMSLELSRRWFPDLEASWIPDALFEWATTSRDLPTDTYGPSTEGLPLEVQELLSSPDPIVSISGSSVLRGYTQARAADLTGYIRSLRGEGISSVLVATSDEDAWLRRVAADCGTPFVHPRIPLIAGMRLIGASSAFVSGRYHPSILAACVGTPIATLRSNSHKTESLQRVLGEAQPITHSSFSAGANVNGLLARTVEFVRTSSRSRDARRAVAEHLATIVRRDLALIGCDTPPDHPDDP